MDDYFVRVINLVSQFGHRLIHFVEDLVFGGFDRFSEDLNAVFKGCYRMPSYKKCNLPWDGCLRTSHSEYGQRRTEYAGHSFVNRNHANVGSVFFHSKLHKRSTNPLNCIELGFRLTSAFSRFFLSYMRHILMMLRGFIYRVQRTLKGSCDDIGWLKRIGELPAVEDGTLRFLEILHVVRKGEHCLPSTLVYLLIPGLFSNHSPLYFVNTKKFFSKMGLTCHIAKIHSEASVEKNAWELKQYIDELYWGSGKRILLLGHSKGGVDAAASLATYWDDLKDKVAGLALVQSPYGGSPIASDILREGQVADKEARRIMEFIICKLIKGDLSALEDLTYERRKEFIAGHQLPVEQLPLVSFHTEASMNISVLATMSHIAHAELPWLPLPKFCSDDDDDDEINPGLKVPVVIPLAASMAICALHLWLRYGVKSDGLVTCCDAEVPGSVVVRPDRKLDHSWMVCSSMRRDQCEADASEMCEALLTLLVEIGQKVKITGPI